MCLEKRDVRLRSATGLESQRTGVHVMVVCTQHTLTLTRGLSGVEARLSIHDLHHTNPERTRRIV